MLNCIMMVQRSKYHSSILSAMWVEATSTLGKCDITNNWCQIRETWIAFKKEAIDSQFWWDNHRTMPNYAKGNPKSHLKQFTYSTLSPNTCDTTHFSTNEAPKVLLLEYRHDQHLSLFNSLRCRVTSIKIQNTSQRKEIQYYAQTSLSNTHLIFKYAKNTPAKTFYFGFQLHTCIS